MLKNSTSQWGSISRTLHWLVAIFIAIEIPLGFWMANLIEANTETPATDAWVVGSINAHHTIGFLVLIVTLLRINWRLNNPAPDLPASMVKSHRYLTRITQAFLYFVLIFYPFTGWAVSSTSSADFPVFFFGLEIPRMIEPQSGGSTFAFDLFSELHQACWKFGSGLLALHLTGAFWGQFIKKNHVLARMWRGYD